MTFISRRIQDAHMERQWRAENERLRNIVEQKFRQMELANSLSTRPAVTSSPNYLPNSGIVHSQASYTLADIYYGTAGNDNRRAYNWYTKEADDFSPSLTAPLISFGHTSWYDIDGNSPVWDQRVGRLIMGWSGSSSGIPVDAVAPLPVDFLIPGQRYYLSFEAILDNSMLNPGETIDADNNRFYCGFYDIVNQDWLTGGPFAAQASIFGASGTRTLSYRIVASRDTGDQIIATELEIDGETVTEIANAPDVLTSENHVRLYYSGAAGYNRYEIYRYDGVVYRKVGDIRNSIDLQFFDINEDAGSIEAGFPDISNNTPKAYAETTGMSIVPGGYTSHTLTITVPATYNRSNSYNEEYPGNTQVFRIGIKDPVDFPRTIAIRRIMLSEGYGVWTQAAQDLLTPSSPVITGDQPDFLPAPIPEKGPTQGPTCVTLDTLVTVCRDGSITEIPIAELVIGDEMISGWQNLPVLSIKDGTVQTIYELHTQNGLSLRASESHRIVRDRFDIKGTPVRLVRPGDTVLTNTEKGAVIDTVTDVRTVVGTTEVRSITLPAPHLFVTNGIVSHNTKTEQNPYGDSALGMGFGGGNPFEILP